MKKILLLICFITAVSVCMAQTKKHRRIEQPSAQSAFEGEMLPEFIGGMDCLNCYLSNVIQYPDSARESGACGSVLVEFVVEKNGSVKNVTVKSSIHPLLDAEAVRGVKSTSEMWKPGTYMGNPMRCFFQVPITFLCPNDSASYPETDNCYCDIEEPYQIPIALQSDDTLMIPLYFDLAKENLHAEDSLTMVSLLQKFTNTDDVEAHFWTYEYSLSEKSEYLYRKRSEYLYNLLHEATTSRSIMLFTHFEWVNAERWQALNQNNIYSYLVLIRKR